MSVFSAHTDRFEERVETAKRFFRNERKKDSKKKVTELDTQNKSREKIHNIGKPGRVTI